MARQIAQNNLTVFRIQRRQYGMHPTAIAERGAAQRRHRTSLAFALRRRTQPRKVCANSASIRCQSEHAPGLYGDTPARGRLLGLRAMHSTATGPWR